MNEKPADSFFLSFSDQVDLRNLYSFEWNSDLYSEWYVQILPELAV